MWRPLMVANVFALAVMAWAPGHAAAQAHLLDRPAPEIAGGPWLNSPPLALSGLRGRVVLVEFWTGG